MQLHKLIKNKYLILTLLISFVVYFRWLPFSIFRNADFGFYYADFLKDFLKPSVWYGNYEIGGVNISLWRLPVFFLSGLFGLSGFNSNIADKFLVFLPIIIILPLSSFLLVRKITRSDIGGFIGSLVFSYNTYFLAINTVGHEYLTVAAGLAVLSLYFFIKTLETKKKFYATITGLFFFLSSAYDLRMSYIIVWLTIFYFLFFGNLSFNLKKIFRSLKLITLPILICLLLSSFWILPLFNVGSLSQNEYLNRGLFGNGFWNLSNSITLFHPFWNGQIPQWFIINKVPLYFWLIPVFAVLGLITNFKNKQVLFFGFVFILGIFLGKQSEFPFQNIYSWLFDNLIGFKAFREASKFYFVTAIGYSVLIGAFSTKLWQLRLNNKYSNYLKSCLLFIIALIFIFNTKPIITGEISTMFVPRYIPEDYLKFNEFIVKQPEYFRTLWVPISRYWSNVNLQHPSINYDSIFSTFWQKYLINNSVKDSNKNKLIPLFYSVNFSQLLNLTSIKYIGVPLEEDHKFEDIFLNYGGNRQQYIDNLNKVKFLKRVNVGARELIVYENKGYRPHIYKTIEKETIYKEIPFENVDFQFRNPTEYKISLKNIKSSTFVNFSEAFHQDWRVRVGEFNWFKVLTEKNYFIPNKYHYKNDAQLNSFLIDPNVICRDYECKKNPDGSYDLNLTLFFSPQSYFYLGLTISGLTLFGCLSYLVVYFVRSRKTKHPKHPKPLPQASTS